MIELLEVKVSVFLWSDNPRISYCLSAISDGSPYFSWLVCTSAPLLGLQRIFLRRRVFWFVEFVVLCIAFIFLFLLIQRTESLPNALKCSLWSSLYVSLLWLNRHPVGVLILSSSSGIVQFLSLLSWRLWSNLIIWPRRFAVTDFFLFRFDLKKQCVNQILWLFLSIFYSSSTTKDGGTKSQP